jgi:succinylglutamate desuccinylase
MASLPVDSKPVKSIVITGGTHGNETNGILIARYFESRLRSNPFPSDPIWRNYQSIQSIKVVYGNPRAIEQNTRYVEEDLNRCFLQEDLNRYKADDLKCPDTKKDLSYERRRAAELNELLGPKGSTEATDLIIDLHTTTSNTGVNMIMSPTDEVYQYKSILANFEYDVQVVVS